MGAEPSEWHAFGDPSELTRGAQPAPAGSPAQSRPLSGAASHQRAAMAVGVAILSAIVGIVVFVATVAIAMGDHGSDVVIAARNAATPHESAAVPALAPAARTPNASSALLVDVEGAVRSPGLHEVPAGSRVGDAITAAGGYADRADLVAAAGSINLAAPLADGAKIHIPVLGEADVPPIDSGSRTSAAPASDGTGQATGLVDLNHADQPALEALPGIGPVTAAKIIAARESAPFASMDDVVTRKALSAAVLDKIRSLVTVTP